MLREPRLDAPGVLQHVMARGSGVARQFTGPYRNGTRHCAASYGATTVTSALLYLTKCGG
ncbi:MAG: hypothetical protein IH856_19850 [Deltaproteobacteria bacterium]|nr:hypothetical protein [Deltaproteobacteria bacterium]MCZ6907053.1 hypothetical protein [Deltaproteobacteria bacterium]